MSEPTIRDEEPPDRTLVRALNERAFGQPAEADLVEALHWDGAVVVALVCELEGDLVGHILFSEVEIERAGGKRVVGLGPMAVAPPLQRQGIGSRLVREGLARCAELGFAGVVLVGHPDYYPRFGFVPAQRFGLRCEYDVPPEVFMALALPGRTLDGAGGLVRYHPEFANA